MATTPTYHEQLQTQAGGAAKTQHTPQIADGSNSALVRLAGANASGVGNMISTFGQLREQKQQQALQRQTAQEGQDAVAAGVNDEVQWHERLDSMLRDAPADGSGVIDQLDKEFGDYSSKSLENYKTEGGRARRELINNQMHAALRKRAYEFEAKAKATVQTNNAEQALQNGAKLVARDADRYSETLAKNITLIDELRGLTGVQRMELKQKQVESLSLATAKGLIDRNPAYVLAQVSMDKPTDGWAQNLSAPHLEVVRDAAHTAATGMQVNSIASSVMQRYEKNVFAGANALAAIDKLGLDEQTKVKVQAEVNKRVDLMRQGRAQLYVEDIAALHANLADGNPPDDAEAKAFGLYAKGAMTEAGYSSMTEAIERARIEKHKAGVDIVLGMDAIRNGKPLDPKDSNARKAVDAAFKELAKGVLQGTPQYQNAAVEIARTTNIVPSDALSWARTSIISGAPDSSAQAVGFLRRMENANPQAFRYVEDDKLKSFVELATAGIESGAPPGDAIAVAQKNAYGISDAQRDTLKRQYNEIDKSADKIAAKNDTELQSRLNKDDRFDHSLFGMGGAPAASAELRGEFDAAVRRYYQYTGGNLEASRNLAWRDVQRSWGYSTVNGAPELIKYAPEAMFPQLPSSIIRDDIKEVASTAPEFKDIKPESLRLIQSPETAGTGGVEWNLGVIGKYGELEVLRASDGQPLRYQLPVRPDVLGPLMQKAKDEEIKKARAYSQSLREKQAALMERMKKGDEAAAFVMMTLPEVSSDVKANAAR